ncbi:hypothetical protein CHS0354_010729 [Potamilus streckersoni]|uniref:ADGRA2/3 GAIN domain-containing protein n=1 Tax=Potamilus streckersoni TaxID=2493646 RepID=A0AAE0SUN0_9BIVA|nr:hypothetical protein CHS0354_010729 [Potamilus streckersoni]
MKVSTPVIWEIFIEVRFNGTELKQCKHWKILLDTNYKASQDSNLCNFEMTFIILRSVVVIIRVILDTSNTPKGAWYSKRYRVLTKTSNGSMNLIDAVIQTKIKLCPTMTINVTNSSTPVVIPFTRINHTGYSWNRCYRGSRAFASAQCLCDSDTGVRWGSVTFAKDCQQGPNLDLSNQSKALISLLQSTVNVQNAKEIINKAANLTSSAELKNADVYYTAEILEKLQQVSSLPSNVLDDVIKVANNMVRLNPDIIHSAQEITSASNRILRAVDDMSNNVSLNDQEFKRVIQPLLAAEIWEQNEPNFIGLEFSQGNRSLIENRSLNTLKTAPDNLSRVDAAIYIDQKVLKGSNSRLAMHVYYDTTMFDDDTGRYETISRVVAARLSKNGTPFTNLGNSAVTAIFLPFKV